SDADRTRLSDLSSAYALFEAGDDGRSLNPVDVTPTAFFDDDLITIQRYPGKTNEQLTHLLVNVAMAVSTAAVERAASGRRARLLDPLAGRGTTLNRGLVYGFDVAGVEVDAKDVEAYRVFLSTYLRDHRRRAEVQHGTVRKGPASGAKRVTIQID